MQLLKRFTIYPFYRNQKGNWQSRPIIDLINVSNEPPISSKISICLKFSKTNQQITDVTAAASLLINELIRQRFLKMLQIKQITVKKVNNLRNKYRLEIFKD